MTKTVKFNKAMYYLKKHGIDINEIYDSHSLYNAFHKIYSEKRILALTLVVTLIAILLESLFLYDIIKHGGFASILCFVVVLIAFIWYVVTLKKENKCFGRKLYFSKGTSKQVKELFLDIVNNDFENFKKYIKTVDNQ